MRHFLVTLSLLVFMLGSVAHADFSGGAFYTKNAVVQSISIDEAKVLVAHNKWRAEVGAPEMAYSKELASLAQAWADQLKNTHDCNMKHSAGAFGENIFWQSALAWSNGRRELLPIAPHEVVDAWGGEKKHYRYADNACAASEVCGHYTQLVWKKSTSVGCGVAVCGNRDQIWVCQYSPAGNRVGEKPY